METRMRLPPVNILSISSTFRKSSLRPYKPPSIYFPDSGMSFAQCQGALPSTIAQIYTRTPPLLLRSSSLLRQNPDLCTTSSSNDTHLSENAPFSAPDAQYSSLVAFFAKTPPPPQHHRRFRFGNYNRGYPNRNHHWFRPNTHWPSRSSNMRHLPAPSRGKHRTRLQCFSCRSPNDLLRDCPKRHEFQNQL